MFLFLSTGDDFLAMFRGDFNISRGGTKSALHVVKSQKESFVMSLMCVHGDKKGISVEHVRSPEAFVTTSADRYPRR